VLARIVDAKRNEAARLAGRAAALRAAAEAAPATRPFGAGLAAGERIAVIAEYKRRSPSAGAIATDAAAAAPAAVARAYEAGGASALSVLTDAEFFGGSLEDLERARAAVSLPVLRKDFVLEPVQVWESRAAGADAVLLIVRILDDARLRELLAAAGSVGLEAVVEVHDAQELERALSWGARIVGVNNRDLDTFRTDLAVTESLAGAVPSDALLVGESGVRDAADVRRLAAAGVDAVLVGESAMRASDAAAAVAALGAVARRPAGSARGAAGAGSLSRSADAGAEPRTGASRAAHGAGGAGASRAGGTSS